MNKNMLIATWLIVALLLASCSTGKIHNTNIETQRPVEQVIQEPIIETNNNKPSSLNVPDGVVYQIITESYSNKGIKIQYPQISGLIDVAKQKTVNEMLKYDAMKMNIYGSEDDSVTLKVDYEVKWKGANLLSVTYSGSGYVKGNAYPNSLFSTSNINIIKGFRLRLSDLVNIDNDLVEKIRAYKVENSEKNQAKVAAVKHLLDSKGNLLGRIKAADAELGYTFSYLTKDSIGISLEVPHAIGDHVELEIKYQDIADKIISENDVWKDFGDSLQLHAPKSPMAINENLCGSDEDILFSFKIKDTSKVLSVCIAKQEPSYIVYRYGTKDNIELEFPQDKRDSWNQFSYSYYLRPGGKQNLGLDLNSLSFDNGGYSYRIYQDYSAENDSTSVGVTVTENATKMKFEIEGLDNSKVGSLINLRNNTRIKQILQ